MSDGPNRYSVPVESGIYKVTTGAGRSADDAARDLWPAGASVLIKSEWWGRSVTYTYLVEKLPPT